MTFAASGHFSPFLQSRRSRGAHITQAIHMRTRCSGETDRRRRAWRRRRVALPRSFSDQGREKDRRCVSALPRTTLPYCPVPSALLLCLTSLICCCCHARAGRFPPPTFFPPLACPPPTLPPSRHASSTPSAPCPWSSSTKWSSPHMNSAWPSVCCSSSRWWLW